MLDLPDASEHIYYHGKGCQNAISAATSGRGGLFEVLKATPEIQNLIIHRRRIRNCSARLDCRGCVRLTEDAVEKVLAALQASKNQFG